MTATPSVPIVCSRCAEPVLGAANRCWSCGEPLGGHDGGAPRFRRSPIPAEWLISESATGELPATAPPDHASQVPLATDRPTTSPFAVVAHAASAPHGDRSRAAAATTADSLPRSAPWWTTGIIASLALAFTLLSPYPWLAWCCAAAAIGLSVASLRKGNRQPIFMLLVLACVLLSISTASVVYHVATSRAIRKLQITPGPDEFEPIDLEDE